MRVALLALLAFGAPLVAAQSFEAASIKLNRMPVFERGLIVLQYQSELRAEHDRQGSPALLSALQDQLGLDLESGGAPVDVVVDGANRPTEN
jgi:hypothetical protein